VGCFVLALGATPGCGGSVAHGGEGEGDPSGGVGGAIGGGGSAGSRAGSATQGGSAGSSGAAPSGGQSQGGRSDPPIGTGCPETEPLEPDLQCSPLDGAACGPGFGCYPYVVHPDGNGCEQQRSGTTCAPSGVGTQGSTCGAEPEARCAPGFVCVVGQRAGKRCAQLCELGGLQTCSGGLLCSELDVPGFGVCG
jgi:hypothetical protein